MKQAIGLAVGLLSVAALVACGEGKVTQCNKMIDVINKVDMKGADTPSEDSLKKLAENLEKNAKDLDAVSVADPKLTELKKKYSDNLRENAKAYTEMSGAMKDNKMPDLAALSKAAEESGKIVDEINKYCKE